MEINFAMCIYDLYNWVVAMSDTSAHINIVLTKNNVFKQFDKVEKLNIDGIDRQVFQ